MNKNERNDSMIPNPEEDGDLASESELMKSIDDLLCIGKSKLHKQIDLSELDKKFQQETLYSLMNPN